MTFLNGITLLLVYQLLGEVTVKLLGLPMPGPVIGMFYLFISLMVFKQSLKDLQESAIHLLSHLSLLYVPAGVSIMVYAHRVAAEWFPILVTLFLSTLITMASIGLTMKFIIKLNNKSKRIGGNS